MHHQLTLLLLSGVLLNAVLGAYFAAALSDPSIQDSDVTLYLNLVAGLLITAGDIGITLGLYLAIIATLYVGLGRTTWWKLLRLDAPVGGALLLVLDIAFFGRNVALASGAQPTRLDRRGLLWLVLIIDLTLLAVTLGSFCVVIYTMSKLKKRGEMHVAAMGKVNHHPSLWSQTELTSIRSPLCLRLRPSSGSFAAAIAPPRQSSR
jgi:hypothetical protein